MISPRLPHKILINMMEKKCLFVNNKLKFNRSKRPFKKSHSTYLNTITI